jgi:hypothetical protein
LSSEQDQRYNRANRVNNTARKRAQLSSISIYMIP